MSLADWTNLPSVVLYDLYHILPLHDRIAASSTCKKWREALFFYPNWRKLHLSTAHCNEEKNQFFITKGLKWCRTLGITYVAEDFSEVTGIIRHCANNDRINELQMVGSGKPVTDSTFESEFSTVIYPFLENCAHLTSLFLYHFEESHRLHQVLSKHKETLISLGLGFVPKLSQPLVVPIITNLSGFQNLKILQLDGMWITDETLLWCSENLPKLRTLILSLTEDCTAGKVPAEVWDQFYKRLPRCKIHLNYLRVENVMDKRLNDLHFMVTMAWNITHLRMIYCCRDFQIKCLDALMLVPRHQHTLTSIWSISDMNKRTEFGGHPFVVCAWCFKHLREIVLSGSIFDCYDVVGMVRMRQSLSVYIASDDVSMDPSIFVNSTTKVFEKLYKVKKTPWKPLDNRRFNDPSLPSSDREAVVLREILNADLNEGISHL